MVTQKLTIRLDESELPEIRMVSGDIGREIQIEVYAREDSENPIDLETYSAEITLIKPDNTFIMDNFTVDKYELPEQAGAVSGSGYYQIKIFTAGDHQIYTGQGRFLVDDMILSDDVIESSSIAFGDRFPEDFATKTWVDDEIEAHGIGTYVAGNPAGEETMPPLVRLQINDDIYPLIHKVEEQEDADITNPADGDVLTYDEDDHKWKNEPLVIPDPTVTKTATGNPIEITDGADAPLVKCVSEITGSQDLHGYDKPWVGGAGKNKLPMTVSGIKSANTSGTWSGNAYTLNGVTFTIETDGDGNVTGIKANGTSTAEWVLLNIPTFTLTAGNYILNGCINGALESYRIDMTPSGTTNLNGDTAFSVSEDSQFSVRCIIRQSGYTANNVMFYPMIRLSTESNPVFIPYSNICPITAYTEGEIEVSDGDGNTTTHTTTYPSAIYRGSEDCVKGEATTEWGMIASYAGETLPGKWISDRDEYAPGTTPSTGAQVAYELATPTTASVAVSNAPIKSLSGYSHIESNTGEMEVEYITQQWDAIMKAAQLDNMKVYSTAEQVVGKWVDGSDVYESVIITEFNNATPQYTLDISNIGGVSTMPVFVSHSVLEAMEGTTPIKQIVMPAASNSGYSSIAVNHQSNAVTGKAYLTVRYIKL